MVSALTIGIPAPKEPRTAGLLACGKQGSSALNYYASRLDEIRVSTAARSADWIYAQHLSMTNEFVHYSDEYRVPEPASALLVLAGLGALMRRRRTR